MRYLLLIVLLLLSASCQTLSCPTPAPHPSDEEILQRATGVCTRYGQRLEWNKCITVSRYYLCEDQRPLSETCLEALTSGRLGK